MVGLDNVGMDQVGDEASFADEVFLEFLDRGILFTNQLNRYHFTKIAGTELMRFINDSHAAIRNLARHLIMKLVENVFDGRHWLSGKGALSELARAHSELGVKFAVRIFDSEVRASTVDLK
jgi:hypothetical protein